MLCTKATIPIISPFSRRIARNSKNLMIVGHNTGLQDIAVELAGSGDPELIMQMRVKYPTAALAILEFNCGDWNDISKKSGHLLDFIKPKDIAP